ncbi:MAG: hypothetical protein CVU57_29575 [Deltaproteobacteria bacterium HGW-Deltaproteobacteria-15]|nr:MAG: hypothetical protein CVU57_29575 [Deltaproteobacteria bacterium HGW-Deltaproteobacteria-15]PKO01691.1 MAG: hypothetical protein CVU43_11760 [Chloroflexi bacterium HGW-Chloroflexi-5]
MLENPDGGPDGGVDLRLRNDGKKIYVQCRHWKARQFGVDSEFLTKMPKEIR